jgi:5-methylcytosine-specific restriction endonuclease McrA
MFSKQKTWRSEKYLEFVRTHNCTHCGTPNHIGGMDAHHINGHNLGGGMGFKLSDIFTLALCRKCHQLVHGNQNLIDQPYHALRTIENAVQSGVLIVAGGGL